MKPVVTVVDYGIGNLLSVSRALEHCGAEVIWADSSQAIAHADYLVLPGVGAFADGMEGLRVRGLIEPIQKFAETGRPFLGICLGMQMMLETSEEFGEYQGLGLIPGKVVAIPKISIDGQSHKIPHIGWNTLRKPLAEKEWRHTILEHVTSKHDFYFVHSFTAVPIRTENRLADCTYNGRVISAAVHSRSLYGCQFHPEKSGEVGLRVLRNFIGL